MPWKETDAMKEKVKLVSLGRHVGRNSDTPS